MSLGAKCIIAALLIAVLFTNFTNSNHMSQDKFTELTELYEKKEFFRLYEYSKSSGLEGWQKQYIDAMTLSLFSRFSESNSNIDAILNANTLSDSLTMQLLEIRLHNMVNTGNYKEASEITETLLTKYAALMDSTEKAEAENSGLIWKAASNIPAQTVEFKDNTNIETSRDMAGLMNLPLTLNGVAGEFVFDTGANFSVITKSYSEKHKVKILDAKIKVGGMTGNKMDSELGVAENLQIGNMVFRNVLLLVMPDEVLSFAGGLYKINGIIGFPVIREMKEIHLKKDGLYVPKTASQKDFRNLVLDGFMPVINVIQGADSLAFSFDTGAKKTILFPPYYEKFKQQIDGKYEVEDIDVGGAGESKTVKGYMLDKVTFKVGSNSADIEDIRLVKEQLLNDSKYFYGNLGQDYFGKFSEMIFNFESMYAEFKR